MMRLSAADRPVRPIAYLTGQYPLVSHTFIQREVEALRSLGLVVLPCAVRPLQAGVIGAAQQAEAAQTFYILTAARNPLRLAAAHLGLLAKAPRRWLGALKLALATRPPGLRALLYQLFYVAEAGVLAAYLKRSNVAHLHNHFGDSSCTVAMLAAQMADIPFSYTEHGPTIFFAPRHWRIDRKIRHARFVVAISHFCRAQMMLFADQQHWDKIDIVHCGIDPSRYDSGRGQDRGKRLLFVGRLAAVKGIPVLFEALAQLRTHHPDVRLTLVGDGPDREGLQALATRLGIADMVTFAGYADEDGVAVHLAGSDIFVLPSFAEGVPVVLMEAMAARLPVVASRVAGVPELVEDGESGYLVPPGSVEALVARIGTLLADPERCGAMGEAGRLKVVADHHVMKEAAKLHARFAESIAQDAGQTAND